MIPMGTLVTVCMFTGLVMAMPQILKKTTPLVRNMLGTIVLAAGLWNVLWYGIQHFAEFWGLAALTSGSMMILTAFYILREGWLPVILVRIKPLTLLLLLGCALMYAIKIASL
jgi:hypothetical protein